MAGVNKVILIGNLGKDPEMRYFPDGTAVANFSIATSDEWKDKNSGEKGNPKRNGTKSSCSVNWRRFAVNT